MPREIKFRRPLFEDGKFKKFAYIHMGQTCFCSAGTTVFEGTTLGAYEQFTGIKDRDRVDVYDGDILLCGSGRVGEVKFGQYKYKEFEFYGFYICSDSCQFPLIENQAVNIIGNIHKNPGLNL